MKVQWQVTLSESGPLSYNRVDSLKYVRLGTSGRLSAIPGANAQKSVRVMAAHEFAKCANNNHEI